MYKRQVSGFTIDEINAVNDLKNAWKLLLDTLDAPLDLEYIKNCLLYTSRCV